MINKKRKAVKKRQLPSRVDHYKKLYDQTMKRVKKANARLDSLERRYKTGTWSSKKLRNRLDTEKMGHSWQKGRIKIKKNITETKLIYVQKATNQFLNSVTSTKAGIKNISDRTKKSIKDNFNIDREDEDQITDEDVEDMYDMLGEDDFQYFADKIGASTLWVIISESKDANDSEDDFISRLEMFLVINDYDIRMKAARLYNKYVA